MKHLAEVWQNLIERIAFDKKASKLDKLEQRIIKLEKLNVALVKKLVSQGHIETSLPGEGSPSRDAREERTIH
ncbi:MAG: hypothetical protein HOI53_06090 [Francisellaceae bacterium]|jgi:hypothetical protein|nr:hypothetical protein [Francisellaceae bacterium]MBT6207579.1 hypothetical protein [Francisellaceae bacterium]MBT6538717.1 hypothetical protein [Francisellaceae bacterium]